MFQQRSSEVSHPKTWGFFGGKKEGNERPIETLHREIKEELGCVPPIKKIIPVNKFTSPNGQFEYNSFIVLVGDEFNPILNKESFGYAWVSLENWPKPLHSGARIQLKSRQFIKKIKTIIEENSTEQ